MDELDKLTDKQLEQLERKLHKLYKDAADELDGTIKEYFQKFEKRDEEMKTALDAGEITKNQYTQWRLAQIGRGQRFEDLRDKLAERMTKANEVAAAYMNDVTPGVYSLNMNYSAYNIERQHGNVGFTVWNDETVRRLAVENPELMPYYPPQRAVKRGIDLAYGKQQISAQITSSILLGHSIPQMASALQQRIEGMNRSSAIRAARTAVTAAQNGGRQATFERAAAMGIKIRRRWVATKDLRTRPEHAHADGQIVGVKEPFDVGGEKLMFPGDGSNASAWNIYNCRCAVVSVEKDGIEAEPRMMRVRNPVTGRNETAKAASYQEWMREKAKEPMEMYRKTVTPNIKFKPISKTLFEKLTISAKKQGATVIYGGPFAEAHLVGNKRASIIGDILVFREDASKSDVYEELRHFWQNQTGFSEGEKDAIRKEYLCEIDAKKHLIRNAKKYKIPRIETEETKRELEAYQNALKVYDMGGDRLV